MLEVIKEYSLRDNSLQSGSILDETARRLNVRNNILVEQAIMTFFHDLFRAGQIAWGYNLSNPNPPFCHLTDIGRKTLENYSRDPSNPDGYWAYLSNLGNLNTVARSYIEEALRTYSSNCFKATAVMVGAASESLALELRDALVDRIKDKGDLPSASLSDWRIKKVMNSIYKEIEKRKESMPNPLSETFFAYWPAFVHQIRTARNDAGHPSSVEAIAQDTVHASLLIFPELFKLIHDIKKWVEESFF